MTDHDEMGNEELNRRYNILQVESILRQWMLDHEGKRC